MQGRNTIKRGAWLEALLLKAQLALDEGDSRKATEELERYVELAPEDWNTRLSLARLYENLNDYPAAMAAYVGLFFVGLKTPLRFSCRNQKEMPQNAASPCGILLYVLPVECIRCRRSAPESSVLLQRSKDRCAFPQWPSASAPFLRRRSAAHR